MAGHVALLPAWSDFEIEAKEICKKERVGLLRAKEFYDTDADFQGWTRERKETFIREIQNIAIGKIDLGISFSVVKSKFLEAKRDHKIAHNESAFGFCFRSVMYELFSDPVLAAIMAKGENLTIVLESGDANAKDAQRIFNWAQKRNSLFGAKLYSFGFADKRSSIGLQWADFLAGTTRRYVIKYDGTYPDEPKILSILRDRIYMIDRVAEQFLPVARSGRRA
jgi:hypothetical protein